MENIKVSELPQAETLNDSGLFYYVDENGDSKQVSLQTLRESIMAQSENLSSSPIFDWGSSFVIKFKSEGRGYLVGFSAPCDCLIIGGRVYIENTCPPETILTNGVHVSAGTRIKNRQTWNYMPGSSSTGFDSPGSPSYTYLAESQIFVVPSETETKNEQSSKILNFKDKTPGELTQLIQNMDFGNGESPYISEDDRQNFGVYGIPVDWTITGNWSTGTSSTLNQNYELITADKDTNYYRRFVLYCPLKSTVQGMVECFKDANTNGGKLKTFTQYNTYDLNRNMYYGSVTQKQALPIFPGGSTYSIKASNYLISFRMMECQAELSSLE